MIRFNELRRKTSKHFNVNAIDVNLNAIRLFNASA